MNAQFTNIKVRYATRFGYVYEDGASGARFISNKYWDAPITASSSSWFDFADSSPCHDHDAYTANHAPQNNGSHVRFWQSASWTNVRGGVHHDYVCSIINMQDTSDEFNTPRNNLATYWNTFKDTSGNDAWTLSWVQNHPAKTWSKPCGFNTPDDGKIAILDQPSSVVTVNP